MFMYVFVLASVYVAALAESWHLAINLNPQGGHISHYCKNWHKNGKFGNYFKTLTNDYFDKEAREMSIQHIAIIRHRQGIPNAFKVWKLKNPGLSLLDYFQHSQKIPASDGSHIYTFIKNATLYDDDPIFSVDGDLVLNWWSNHVGIRIAVCNGSFPQISGLGLGSLQAMNTSECPTALSTDTVSLYGVEAGTTTQGKIQGHQAGSIYVTVPAYGSYSVYISDSKTPLLLCPAHLSKTIQRRTGNTNFIL